MVSKSNKEPNATKKSLSKGLTVTVAQYVEFMEEFKEESDRAAVILGAAKLDLLLYQILIKILVPNVGSNDELFDGESPLSTFSAKIHLCYRMGLIDSALTRSLHLIRKIRNNFAHEVTGCKLDSGSHRDRVKILVTPFKKIDKFKEGMKTIFGDKTNPSVDFRMALAWIVLGLEILLANTEPLELKPERLIPLRFLHSKSKKSPKEDISS